MKRTFIILFILIFTKAQALGNLSGKVTNLQPDDKILLTIPFDCWYYKDTSIEVEPDKSGQFNLPLKISTAQNIFVHINGEKLLIYAEPGKHITFFADGKDIEGSVTFSGDLQNENNFRKQSGLLFSSLSPEKIDYQTASLTAIKQHIDTAKSIFENRLRRSNVFSKNFKKITFEDLRYVEHSIIWDLIMGDRKVLRKDRESWSRALTNAYATAPINNPKAIESHFYQITLAYFPRYIHISSNKNQFKEKVQEIMGKPFEEALKEIRSKGERFWEFKVYTTYFSGEVLEKLLASFIENGIRLGELDYLTETNKYFIQNFENSYYRAYTDQLMKPLLELEHKENKIIFQTTTHSNDTFSKIIAPHKGNVVLIDLWGTWCGPCKKEFKYSKELKDKLKNKPIDFIYIAFEYNRDNPEEIWKKTVNFYELNGRHILANEKLKRNIEMLYGSPDRKYFPRYILINKNGEIENLTAPNPSSKGELYNQIASLLN